MTRHINVIKSNRFLRKEDVDPELTFTILKVVDENVSMEGAPDEHKHVVHFDGEEKGFILNWTNAQLVSNALGTTDMDAWPGQQITLYQDLTARENLHFWGRMYELRGEALTRAANEGLEAVGLSDRADDRVGSFSGGMQRRLNLAAGLLHEPGLVTLDEPTAGVDPQSRSAIFELVERLRDRGVAILYTTHYMEEAERLCDRVGIIDGGRLVAEGTRRELIAQLGQDVRIEVGFGSAASRQAAEKAAGKVPGVRNAHWSDERLHVFADDGRRCMPVLLSALLDASLAPTSVEVVEPNLEDVFLHLTGHALRD